MITRRFRRQFLFIICKLRLKSINQSINKPKHATKWNCESKQGQIPRKQLSKAKQRAARSHLRIFLKKNRVAAPSETRGTERRPGCRARPRSPAPVTAAATPASSCSAERGGEDDGRGGRGQCLKKQTRGESCETCRAHHKEPAAHLPTPGGV